MWDAGGVDEASFRYVTWRSGAVSALATRATRTTQLRQRSEVIRPNKIVPIGLLSSISFVNTAVLESSWEETVNIQLEPLPSLSVIELPPADKMGSQWSAKLLPETHYLQLGSSLIRGYGSAIIIFSHTSAF